MEHRRKSISTILRLFALAAAFICAAAFAVPAAAENGGEIPERDLYEFSIQAMEEGRRLRVWGLMRLTYVNRSADTRYSIVLRLHANDVEANCMGIGSVGADGRSAAYTLSGEPERITPITSESSSGYLLYGRISQNVSNSRTRRPISCVVCDPKSKIIIFCILEKQVSESIVFMSVGK